MSGNDSELVERAKTDPAAFGELYRRHVDRIYNYIYHRVGNAADAEDLTARTFYRALVSMPSYVDRGAPFSAWLFRIAHNLVANWHRDHRRYEVISLDSPEAGLSSESTDEPEAARTLEQDAVADAIRRLDPDRRALLIMKVQGLSNAEIAEVLGRTEGAVKSLYHRTLVELRQALQEVSAPVHRPLAEVEEEQ